MKRIVVIFLIFLTIIVFNVIEDNYAISPQDNCAYAISQEDVENKINSEIDNRLDELDLNEFELFFQELADENLKTIGTTLRQIIKDIISNNRKLDLNTAIDIIVNVFLREIVKSLPLVITIVIIAILFGMFSGLTSEFSKDSTRQIIYLVCYGAIISILGYAITSSVIAVKSTINQLDNVMSLAFPILLTLTTALGGATTATIYQPVMTIMVTLMIRIINVVILPLFIAATVFGIVGNLSDNVKLDKLTKTTKSISEWILGILFSLFITYITAQGIAGSAFDTVSIKSAKFALSSYVPILGGYLSEGFDLVLASCVIIKNAIGLCSILLLFFIILVPILKILTLVFALRIASAIVESVSDEKMANLLYATSKNLVTLIVILLGLSFLFLVVIMLIIMTANFGVI